ncbi:MAG TPA: hypothetical protein VI854_08465, partial [Acidimicrobiia bacterium]|nr:hypothetical protein [Acidimicrobiia bacterium]
YDGRSPGEPGFPEAIPGPGDAAPVAAPKPVMSSIQPGAPGSVETRYADPAPLAGPVSAEEAYDPGFALTLPYPKEVRLEMAPPPEPPRLLGTVAVFESGEQQQRVLVGVAAAGLLTFIVSMQVVFLTRKPGRLPDLAVTSDWD